MAYIRTPIATNARHPRLWRTSPRCLVLALCASFFAFNWFVFHVFHFTPIRLDPIDPLGNPSPPFAAAPYTDHFSKDSTPGGYGSYQRTKDWFAHWIRWRGLDPGYADLAPDTLRFDIVYTWVNGSDPSLQRLRRETQARSPVFANLNPANEKNIEAVTTKRFRDMDELRYSIRSVAEYARDLFRHVHLLTTDVRPGEPGQTPDWLNPYQDIVRPVHHRSIFTNPNHLPSFNSLAIESQIHHIPGVTDVFMYLNDDVFLGTTMLPSDIWTPLYGFVFHMEGSLLVPPTIRPTEANPLNVGEWSSLQYSNYLLSQRFGPRFRAYLAHVPHVLSVSMLNEIQSLWPQEFDQTSSHQFRGEGEARDVQVSFFMAHYVVEKLRETQLESYWLHRLDQNKDGALDWAERETLIRLVQSWNLNQLQPDSAKELHSRPTVIHGYDQVLRRVGIPMSGSTTYQLAGLDGYPFLLDAVDTSKTIRLVQDAGGEQQQQTPYKNYERPQKRTCQLDLAFCFGSEFLNPSMVSMSVAQARKIFDRVAFDEFHCGDCLLEILMQHKDTGMSAWMPSDEESEAFRDVVEKVARYNYVLGTSDYSFIALQGAEGSQKNLDALMAAKQSKAFFCINDDYPDNPTLQNQIHSIFNLFLNERFPTSSPWERPRQL